ncbi:uncharacterized protein LOC122052373 isoform X3 [Zingiber officinale]|uniref:uncharacterized protein LOC122052373 isoform X3 n=1 Tax=Zingiber officinale TaxID=94328 RepID=UPI001C4D74B0|nr:uncharacterized protein LOC122052373 isoform X3 [Zingiber officinale]
MHGLEALLLEHARRICCVGLDACCHSAHAGARLKNQIFFFKHVLRRSEILEEGSFKQWKDNWTCVQKPGRLEIGRVPLSRVMLHSLKEQCFFIGKFILELNLISLDVLLMLL